MKKIEEWESFFLSRGISEHYIEHYLKQVRLLTASDSPVVFELEHLSLMMGIKLEVLMKMVHASSSFYRRFSIKKRAGGLRDIDAPYPSLLHCQDWIYREILLKTPVHESAHGYVPGRSIFSNAKAHLDCKTLLKMDLKDFFPSIGIGWVVNFFSGLGYSNEVSFSLASLCCKKGKLVQGASTSPYLTNILLRNFDQRLSLLSLKYGIVYTRYADDLTFSGNYISSGFVGVVSSLVSEFGLIVNESKTRLLIDKNKKIVTGLSVSGAELRITRELRRLIKKEVFYIKRYGFISHVSQMKIKDPFYLDSIFGKVNFWLQAEPENSDAISCKRILQPLFSKRD